MAEELVLVLLSSAMFFALKFQSVIHNVYIIRITAGRSVVDVYDRGAHITEA